MYRRCIETSVSNSWLFLIKYLNKQSHLSIVLMTYRTSSPLRAWQHKRHEVRR